MLRKVENIQKRRMIAVWYAVQVATGREETTRDMCRKLIDKELYKDIFIIRFDKAKKYYGEWHKEKKIMFPGYMFIDTDNPNEIYEQLKNVPEFMKILGRNGNDFIAIESSKEALFKAMVSKNYEIPISIGVIEGDKVIVKEGPLVGMEAYIKKIDRHKKVAILKAEMFEQEIGVSVGLEVIEKYGKKGEN